MDSKLFCEVVERIKAMASIEAFLVLPVATLYLPIMAGRVGTDELVSDAKFGSGGFKKSGQIPLDTLHPNPPAGIPLKQLV